MIKKSVFIPIITSMLFSWAPHSQAMPIVNGLTPTISSGSFPDSPSAHVDANTSASPFSGVVSIYIQKIENGALGQFICSGTLVSKRHVLTAGHCVDGDGRGHAIDLNAPNTAVGVVFNSGTERNGNTVINADSITMNPEFQGFNACPTGINGNCPNDDLAIITLAENAPDSAKIYNVGVTPMSEGQQITMVGYGLSGDGINGYTISPSFRTKRVGQNNMDFFFGNDEMGFNGSPEVWFADFDGGGKDAFCPLGICDKGLGNSKESNIGMGDSGGPSFVLTNSGEYLLVGNTSFSSANGQIPGAFGSFFGGILASGYLPWINSATAGQVRFVPEPGSLAILGLGLGMLLVLRRRTTS